MGFDKHLLNGWMSKGMDGEGEELNPNCGKSTAFAVVSLVQHCPVELVMALDLCCAIW